MIIRDHIRVSWEADALPTELLARTKQIQQLRLTLRSISDSLRDNLPPRSPETGGSDTTDPVGWERSTRTTPKEILPPSALWRPPEASPRGFGGRPVDPGGYCLKSMSQIWPR